MSNLSVDRDKEYMRQMWGTTHLITDYKTEPPKRIIQEIMHDLAPNHNLKKQTDLHEKIRNDETLFNEIKDTVMKVAFEDIDEKEPQGESSPEELVADELGIMDDEVLVESPNKTIRKKAKK